MDELTLLCEPSTEAADVDALGARIRTAMHAELGLTVRVRMVPPGGVPRSEGKAVRVVDQRQR
jgi:phenylacetate-CoA ligase